MIESIFFLPKNYFLQKYAKLREETRNYLLLKYSSYRLGEKQKKFKMINNDNFLFVFLHKIICGMLREETQRNAKLLTAKICELQTWFKSNKVSQR